MRLHLGLFLLAALSAREVAAFAFDRIENVKDHGAIGNGTTNDWSAINAALVAAGCQTSSSTNPPTAGGMVYFPKGTYAINSELVITNACTIVGVGQLASTVITTSSSANIFAVRFFAPTVGTWAPVVFRDLALTGSTTSSGSAILYVHHSTTPLWANGLRIEGVRFGIHMAYNAKLVTSSSFVIDRCWFQGARIAEVLVDNNYHIDVGNSVISNSTFFSAAAPMPTAAIYQIGAGGLRVVSNKFIGYNYHYYNDLTLSGDVSHDHITSILHFSENDSEWPIYANVAFNLSSGSFTSLFNTVLIQNNNFSICGTSAIPNPIHNACENSNPQGAILVSHSAGSQGLINRGVITGNVFKTEGGTRSTGVNMYQPASGGTGRVEDWYIADNLFQGLTYGVFLQGPAGTISRVQVAQNKFHGVTSKLYTSVSDSGSLVQLLDNPSTFTPPTESDAGTLFIQNGVLKFKQLNGTVKTVVLQ